MLDTKESFIIGGGIAGCMIALELTGRSITIYEKNELLHNNHYCHAHFGLLYPDISREEVVQLTKETLMFIDFFSESKLNVIQYRPTIIMYHIESKYSTEELIERCKIIEEVIYIPNSFYKIYSCEDLLLLCKRETFDYFDSYVYNTIKHMKLDNLVTTIKFPFVCVNEYGINPFLVKEDLLIRIRNSNIKVIKEEISEIPSGAIIATGYQKPLSTAVPVEKKASFDVYVNTSVEMLAEMAIIGERGTENGMFQVTPIEKNHLVIHKMSPRGSLGEFDTNYIKDVFSNYYCHDVTKVEANPGYQEINSNILDRRSDITLTKTPDGITFYSVKLLKACSSVYIAKKLRGLLDSS